MEELLATAAGNRTHSGDQPHPKSSEARKATPEDRGYYSAEAWLVLLFLCALIKYTLQGQFAAPPAPECGAGTVPGNLVRSSGFRNPGTFRLEGGRLFTYS